MIEAIVCDFGGVLTTPLAGSFAAFSREAEIPLDALGEAITAVALRNGANPLHELETGDLSASDFFAALEAELGAALGRPATLSEFTEIYWNNLAPNHELIAHLHTLGHDHRLALLTNNVAEWRARWQAMVPIEVFELVIDSSEVGLRKPDPKIYELTLERLALPASACLFIDDLADNCAAAAAAGMQVIQFHDNAQTFAALAELTSATS